MYLEIIKSVNQSGYPDRYFKFEPLREIHKEDILPRDMSYLNDDGFVYKGDNKYIIDYTRLDEHPLIEGKMRSFIRDLQLEKLLK